MRLLRNVFIIMMLISFQLAAAGKRQYYTIDEMASRIQKQTGAQILSADIQQTKRGKIYRFKVNKKGRVRVLLMRPDGTRINRR
ncbi:hypothetical protein BMS3Bbin11_00878 [bacterium BMS3Bbin11]|nr:hypothetical protein BMS3Abin11_01250 [bacterium BMS3Abin11]GBE45785.1 hypothetical protein BMS3Bbin11_00878 [bacterium BMS3Bbin11]GMT41190.1 MAG: hypothetical protein IEMM0001_1925 [bacterium]HDH16862.1 hypothetical protein [Gammaproteobacteria bacterium]HDZ78841.1 hypothetical protein [Gammaproteobacteria bacterium]